MQLVFSKGLFSCCVEKRLQECRNKGRDHFGVTAVVQAGDEAGLDYTGIEEVVRGLTNWAC